MNSSAAGIHSSASPQPGSTLSRRYVLDARIGRGGMAEVYRGRDLVLRRTVAVKILSEHLCDDHRFVARFRREAHAAAALTHPNVVAVFDAGSEDGIHYIVMEYVEGKTLHELLSEAGRLGSARVAEISQAVCRALAAAHERGIVHRDIKPANVMLAVGDHVKVTDFGIARYAGGSLTGTSAVLGTALYQSPEQARGESPDGRSDLYSLGCVMYEMLSGKPPFEGDSPVTVAYRHATRPPPELPDIPSEMKLLVLRALAKDRSDRFEDAAAMLSALETARGTLRDREERDATIAVPRRASPVTRPRPSRRLAVALLIVGVAIAAVAQMGSSTVEVPGVEGLQNADATRVVRRAGMLPSVVRRYNARIPKGVAFAQRPREMVTVEKGTRVRIFVSRGPRMFSVPSVFGLTLEQARARLANARLVIGSIGYRAGDDAGFVIGQVPRAGVTLPKGGEVDVIVTVEEEEEEEEEEEDGDDD